MSEAQAYPLLRRQETSMRETRGIIRGFEQTAESPKPLNNSSPLLLEDVKSSKGEELRSHLNY